MRRKPTLKSGGQGESTSQEPGRGSSTERSGTPSSDHKASRSTDLYKLLFQRSVGLTSIFQAQRNEQGHIVNLVLLDANQNAFGTVDHPLDEIHGFQASQLIHDKDQFDIYLDLAREADRTGQPARREYHLAEKSRYIQQTIVPLEDDCFAAFNMDMTKPQLTNQALLESKQRLSWIQESASFGLWDWDASQDELHWDAICRKLFGLTAEEPVDYQVLFSRVHPEDLPLVEESIQKAKTRASDYHIEYRVLRRDGSELWVLSRGRSYSQNGKVIRFSGMVADITRRKLAEIDREKLSAEMSRQNALLERMVREAPMGIAITQGPEHRYVFANEAIRNIAAGKGELVGRTVAEVWPEAADQFVPLMDQVYRKSETVSYKNMPFYVDRGRGLETAYFTLTLTSQPGGDGQSAVVILATETTDQIVAIQGLSAEQARLQSIFASAPVAILFVDANGRIQRGNLLAEKLLGQPVLQGQKSSTHRELDMLWPDGSTIEPRQQPLTRSALDGEQISNLELIVRRPDGSTVPILLSSGPLRSPSGTILGAIAVFQDVSEQLKAEAERQRSAATIEMHHHLIQSREMERMQIAHQLHEGLLQELIGLQFSLDQSADEDDPNQRQELISSIQTTLAQQIRELRDYCYELRPPALTSFGLEKAIRSHAEGLRSRHPQIEFLLKLRPDYQTLSEGLRLVLFRVYQEVISNVIRHSQAREVTVRFKFDETTASLEIKDNGDGFMVPTSWVEAARRGRLGLIAAQERVEAVGGHMEILSKSGKGTRVSVRVPLSGYLHGDD